MITNTRVSMRSLSRATRMLALSTACASAACAGKTERTGDPAPSTPGDAGGVLAEGPALDGAAPPALLVTIETAKASLCAGECATLHAVARGAEAELRYDWGTGESAERVEVCPEATTVYTAHVAEEGVNEGEFVTDGRASDDALTLSVRDCTPLPEDPQLCEARFRFDEITQAGILGTPRPWLTLFTGTAEHLRSDARGSALLIGTFGGRVELGNGAVEAGSAANGVLMKLDDSCHVTWSRVLTASVTSDALMPVAIDTDAAGNSYVAAIAGPVFDLSFLTPMRLSFGTELVVYKFDADGDEVFRRSLSAGPGFLISDFEVDAAENVYLAGIAHSATDFGDGPIGLSPTAFHPFLLGLDADGDVRFSDAPRAITRVVAEGDSLYTESGGFETFDFLGALAGAGIGEYAPVEFTAEDRATRSERWRIPSELGSSTTMGARSVPGFARLVMQTTGEGVDEDLIQRWRADLHYHAPDGRVERTVSVIDVEQRAPLDDQNSFDLYLLTENHASQMAIGANEETLVSGTFNSDFRVLGRDITPVSERDVFVGKVDGEGTPLWTRTFAWGSASTPIGLAITPTGETWISGQAMVSSGTGEFDVVISRLKP